MAIKKHSSSARTRERSCREGRRVRWRTIRQRSMRRMNASSRATRVIRQRSMNCSPSPSKGWSSCLGNGWGSPPSRCPRWTPSSWDEFWWENQSNNDSATSASWNKLRRKNRTQERGGGGGWEDLRLDGLAEGPPLHLGLEPHVGDLQAEAVPVHGGGVGVGFAWDEGWPIIDWERRRLVAPARPPTGFPRPFLLLWTRHWWQHLLRVLISSELILVRPI